MTWPWAFLIVGVLACGILGFWLSLWNDIRNRELSIKQDYEIHSRHHSTHVRTLE